MRAHEYMRKHKQLPYVLWQLALWVLFNKRADKEEDENKRLIVLEHQHAAIPFIGSGGAELLREQVTCSTCHVGLWNLYLAPKDTANEKRCYSFVNCGRM